MESLGSPEPVQTVLQEKTQGLFQAQTSVFDFGKADSDDRVFLLPVPLVVDPAILEEFFVAGKQLLHGADQQGFTEAPGAGKEVISAVVYELIDQLGFVDVDQVVCFEGWEVLNA